MAFIFLCFEVLWNVQCCTFAQYHLHNMPVQYDIFDYGQRQVMFLLHVGEGGGSVVSFKYGAGIAQLVVLGLTATVSRVRYSSGDIFR